MNELEAERDKRVAANLALLNSFGLLEAAADLAAEKRPVKPPREHHEKAPIEPRQQPHRAAKAAAAVQRGKVPAAAAEDSAGEGPWRDSDYEEASAGTSDSSSLGIDDATSEGVREIMAHKDSPEDKLRLEAYMKTACDELAWHDSFEKYGK